MRLSLRAEGIAVVDPGPWGARVGLRGGDVILAINGTAPETPQAVAALLRGAAPRIQIDVMRVGKPLTLRFRT